MSDKLIPYGQIQQASLTTQRAKRLHLYDDRERGELSCYLADFYLVAVGAFAASSGGAEVSFGSFFLEILSTK